MLSQCPHCHVPVLFTSESCPNCLQRSQPEERKEIQHGEDSSRHDFEIIPATKGNQPLWLAVIAIILGFMAATFFQAWLMVAFCALVAALCSIVPVTTVYGNDGRIERTWKFLSVAPVWQNRYLASEFSAVRLTFRDSGNSDSSPGELRYWWFVELVKPTGKSIRVYQIVSSDKTWTCREAQELQERLSKLAGLPTTERRLG